jgi:hypothetical protein
LLPSPFHPDWGQLQIDRCRHARLKCGWDGRLHTRYRHTQSLEINAGFSINALQQLNGAT